MPNTCIPAAPTYLSADLHRRFEELAPKLSAQGLLAASDVDTFAKYLIAEGEYLRVTNHVTSAINRGDATAANTWITAQDKILKQIMSTGSEFGLTPTSRRRLGLEMEV